MTRTAPPLRLFLYLLLILFVLACSNLSSAATEPPAEEPPVVATEPPAQEPPVAEDIPTQQVVSTALPNTGGGSLSPTAQPAIPERRRITLEFPPQIRAGDSDVVRLTLEVDDLGNVTPTAEVGGNVVTGEVIEIPNLYATHNVIAEARFDIAGMQVSPPGLTSQPLAQGQSVSFYWSILPDGVGVYRGTVWLYLRFVDRVSGEESQKAVSAQPVEIEAVNFLGLSADLARSFGVVGSIAGTIIGFPFLEDIVKFVFRRRRFK
ncbi:MAG: hypothetical protein IT314_17310 [Anaerolineales bacterium]|nr:hypothetical protein [Anaerolineales bacterium]